MNEKKKKTKKLKKPVKGQIDFERVMGAYRIVHQWKENLGGPKSMPLILMKFAVNHDGHYIGNSRFTYRLVKKYGITRFEPRNSEKQHCSIGFNSDTKTWYGFSHRAICGYIGRNAKQRAKRFAKSVS